MTTTNLQYVVAAAVVVEKRKKRTHNENSGWKIEYNEYYSKHRNIYERLKTKIKHILTLC